MTKNIIIQSIYIIFLVVIVTRNTEAQHLPDKQHKSLRAPVNIKIDGKLDEWVGKFQAYNHATNIFYTLSNDDDNLYFVMQTSDPDALTKITNVGVTFSVYILDKKRDKNAISINYPAFDKNNKPYINFRHKNVKVESSSISELIADSIMSANNKLLSNKTKYIITSGIATLDSIISIYNTQGIKVAQEFDKKMNYNYELAIPLKFLKQTFGNISQLGYHISLPGLDISRDFGISAETDATGKILRLNSTEGAAAAIPSKSHFEAISSTTDLRGEYMLIQKNQ